MDANACSSARAPPPPRAQPGQESLNVSESRDAGIPRGSMVLQAALLHQRSEGWLRHLDAHRGGNGAAGLQQFVLDLGGDLPHPARLGIRRGRFGVKFRGDVPSSTLSGSAACISVLTAQGAWVANIVLMQ
jgi:hypothetical protein